MPFIANTPESLIGRTDSKNPSTTCRGITSGGRPCRRPLGSNGAPVPPVRSKFGKLRVDDPSDETLYCWQHKDQASLSARSSPGPRASHTPILEERTSLDTLADRLGLLDVEQKRKSEKHTKKPRPSVASEAPTSSRPPVMTRPKPKHQATFCFCFKVPVEEVPPPPRPKPRPVQNLSNRSSWKKQSSHQLAPASSRPRPSVSGGSHTSKHSNAPSTSSQTAQYMSLIPATASPQTASQLLAELAKPISQQDDPGYIYMFWLTPESQPATPPAEAARSLLAPPSTPTRPRAGQRRPSDILDAFSVDSKDRGINPGANKKLLLKIGRATNVQRRLNEWTRQCGYNLSLIRYYPYISSSSPGPVAVPRKMPHSHKVERLIHLELAGAGLRVSDKEKCAACGKDHREWFEVDASRNGVMEVDAIIRRWVDWDEGR